MQRPRPGQMAQSSCHHCSRIPVQRCDIRAYGLHLLVESVVWGRGALPRRLKKRGRPIVDVRTAPLVVSLPFDHLPEEASLRPGQFSSLTAFCLGPACPLNESQLSAGRPFGADCSFVAGQFSSLQSVCFPVWHQSAKLRRDARTIPTLHQVVRICVRHLSPQDSTAQRPLRPPPGGASRKARCMHSGHGSLGSPYIYWLQSDLPLSPFALGPPNWVPGFGFQCWQMVPSFLFAHSISADKLQVRQYICGHPGCKTCVSLAIPSSFCRPPRELVWLGGIKTVGLVRLFLGRSHVAMPDLLAQSPPSPLQSISAATKLPHIWIGRLDYRVRRAFGGDFWSMPQAPSSVSCHYDTEEFWGIPGTGQPWSQSLTSMHMVLCPGCDLIPANVAPFQSRSQRHAMRLSPPSEHLPRASSYQARVLCLGTFRIGEAHVPGPPSSNACELGEWSLGAINPSGLLFKSDHVRDLPQGIFAVSESALTHAGEHKIRRELKFMQPPRKLLTGIRPPSSLRPNLL